MKKYYQNEKCGYIVESRRELVRNFFEDLFKFRVICFKWSVIYLSE